MTVAVLLGTLLILGAIIFAAREQVRSQVRKQIAGRDAKVFYTLLLNLRSDEQSPNATPSMERPEDHLEAILEASRFRKLPSVKATRLFDSKGTFLHAFPADVPDAALSAEDLATLRKLEPVAHFQPQARLVELSSIALTDAPDETLPLLEVLLPLHSPGHAPLSGVAQFLLDGQSIAREFKALDQSLTRQALVAFFTAGTLLTALLAFAFRQLEKTNELLSQRTERLLKANQELSLAAKTAAVGAVSAHLIHGLKNPLSGLQSFMAGRGAMPASDDADWEMAVATTRRMQSLINDTVRVLREQDGAAQYELTLDEVVELARSKMAALALAAGVELHAHVAADARFTNRDANLILLILENLMTNAIQATPRQKAVTLEVAERNDSILCLVRDQGPGLPEALKTGLFMPCQSTKEGGSGIGLAICKQLANALGAELELRNTSSSGCVFGLVVPLKMCVPLPSVSSA